MDDLKRYIREVPDFPKPGILFYDITTLLKDPLALRMTVDRFAGCSCGAAGRQGGGHGVARLHVRAHRRLRPERRLRAGAQAGQAAGARRSSRPTSSSTAPTGCEMHADAIEPGERVLIVDDLDRHRRHRAAPPRSWSSSSAARWSGSGSSSSSTFLEPRERLADYRLESLIQY